MSAKSKMKPDPAFRFPSLIGGLLPAPSPGPPDVKRLQPNRIPGCRLAPVKRNAKMRQIRAAIALPHHHPKTVLRWEAAPGRWREATPRTCPKRRCPENKPAGHIDVEHQPNFTASSCVRGEASLPCPILSNHLPMLDRHLAWDAEHPFIKARTTDST